MKNSDGDRASARPLFIDFDLYTDGDVEFKIEFTQLMIDNLRELQEVIQSSLRQNNGKLFSATYHKVAATVEMLRDEELIEHLNVLNAHFKGDQPLTSDGLKTKGETLHGLLTLIARSLTVEIAA